MVRVIPINWDCEDKELEIPRYKLVNFDEDEHIKYIEDESVRNFVMGMLDFAEWDVGTRRSYYWPEFIKTLVSSPKQLYDWCRMAENHVVYVFFGSKKRRLHMFILCLQHIGLLEDTIESSDGWGTCSSIRETVTQLMQSAICTEDISVEKCERNCVRVGDMYQVDVPAFDPNRPPSPVNLSDNSEQIYSPDNDVADEEIDKYLGILRNRITSCEGVVVSTVKMTKSTQARHPNLLEHLKHETNVKNIFIKASKYRLNVATCCVMGQAETLGGIEPFADAPTTSFDLMVTDGTNRWRTPVNYVYLRGFHEDVALSILHAAKYNSAAALKDPKLLAFDELLHCPLWTPDQLKFFKSKTEIYGTNVRKVWEKMNKAFRISRPIKSVVDMYYSLYPEAERESARSDASAMSVSRSVSQSTSYQAAPVATKKVLRANPSNYPNRWPSHLPLTRDNLYGLRSSNTPCVCLTLEIPSGNAEAMMRVIPINTTTYHHEVCLNASQIIPLTQEMLNISDARTAEFVLAMRDFALWERSLHPECVWYLYPSFLLNMIKKPTEWSSWRKRYERAARGSNDNKQNIYFNGLIETHKLMADTDDRDMSATFPWDDSPILPPQPKTSQPVHLVHSADQKACTLPPLPSMSSYTHPTTVASNLSPLQIQVPRAPSVSSTSSTPKITEDRKRRGNGSASSESSPKPRLRNETNLFWLANNELPGIFYGYEGDEKKDKFRVLPFCCNTYHYDVEVSAAQLEPLTEEKLMRCHDERTQEFALALLDMYKWDMQRKSSDGILPPAEEREPYKWPYFVLDLVAHPKIWNTFRKHIERKIGAFKRGDRRIAYFAGLVDKMEEYEALVQENSSNEEASGFSDSSPSKFSCGGEASDSDPPRTPIKRSPVRVIQPSGNSNSLLSPANYMLYDSDDSSTIDRDSESSKENAAKRAKTEL